MIITVTSINEDALYGPAITEVLLNNIFTMPLAAVADFIISEEQITLKYSDGLSVMPHFSGTYFYEDNIPIEGKEHWYKLLKKQTTELIIPPSMHTIESGAFSGFNHMKIKGSTLPSELDNIGENAFYGCSELVLNNVNPKFNAQNIFGGCKLITYSQG